MKKHKIGLILITVLLVACVALAATACHHDDGNNKPTTYTLSFVAEDETISPIVSEAGLAITPPSAPEIANKRFLGWFLNDEGDAVELPTIMPAENRTYYARYESIDDGGDEEEITIPDEYDLKLNEKDADNHLYIVDGTTVYLEYDGKVIKSELSIDGNYVEFTLNRTDYCAVLEGANGYGVYEYGYSKDSYLLYLPMDNSFNRERVLVFVDESNFKIVGETNGNDWALGTYSVVNSSTQEYSLTVKKDNTYGLFSSCQVKLTKRVRKSGETGAKALVYNAFNIFEEEIYGNFTSPDGEKLSLDGYGYAIYTDANGKSSNGYCEATKVDGFADDFFTMIDSATGKSSIYIVAGSTFIAVGNEIGLYQVYDAATKTPGYYFMRLDGEGGVDVFYYDDTAVSATLAVSGTYELLQDGEIKYTFAQIEDSADVDEIYKDTFNFKLTEFYSSGGLYVNPAFTIYNEELAGTWTSDDDGTIVLDGYGNATHNGNGSSFSGSMMIDNDLHLFLITDENDNQRIFRFENDGDEIVFRQIGLEIGYYYLCSYANGIDTSVRIYFDGEGNAEYYLYNEDDNVYVSQKSGSYTAIANEDYEEYEIEFEGESKFKISIDQVNLGTIYNPQWYTIYVVYEESLAGTFTGAGGARLTLDGYGFSATFRSSNGAVYEGEFIKVWNVVTLYSYDEEDEETVFVFKLSGNSFTIQQNTEAGVYYKYLPDSDGMTNKIRIALGGDGTACYMSYDDSASDYIGREAHYTRELNSAIAAYVYSFTFDNGSDAPLKFIVTKIGTTDIFVEYNANWAGTYKNFAGAEPLVLDGYGRAIFKNDTTEIVFCTIIFGNTNGSGEKNNDAVTFFYDTKQYSFILHKDTENEANNYYESTTAPIGVYYSYQNGTVGGYVRMIIGANNQIELQNYSEDEQRYISQTVGTYTVDNGIYTFNPTSGDSFTFKLSEVGAYSVYQLANGRTLTEYTGTLTMDNGHIASTNLTLDGYGNATYNFYHTDDGQPRTRTGYYYYSEEDECFIFIAVNEDGQEYWAYYIELDEANNTFEIVKEYSPYYV